MQEYPPLFRSGQGTDLPPDDGDASALLSNAVATDWLTPFGFIQFSKLDNRLAAANEFRKSELDEYSPPPGDW